MASARSGAGHQTPTRPPGLQQNIFGYVVFYSLRRIIDTGNPNVDVHGSGNFFHSLLVAFPQASWLYWTGLQIFLQRPSNRPDRQPCGTSDALVPSK